MFFFKFEINTTVKLQFSQLIGGPSPGWTPPLRTMCWSPGYKKRSCTISVHWQIANKFITSFFHIYTWWMKLKLHSHIPCVWNSQPAGFGILVLNVDDIIWRKNENWRLRCNFLVRLRLWILARKRTHPSYSKFVTLVLVWCKIPLDLICHNFPWRRHQCHHLWNMD